MQLRTKIILNNSLLAGLLLVSNATSFVALGTQTETARFLAQDARNTSHAVAAADNAIGAQMLAVQHTLNGLSGMVATPPAAATQAAEASTSTRAVAPLQKLHSGRPWPRHHFRRLPESAPAAAHTGQPVDASHAPLPAQRRGFWRPRR